MVVKCRVRLHPGWRQPPQGHGDGHVHHSHGESDHPHHHDLNLKSAYIPVIADATTSVLTIAALSLRDLLATRDEIVHSTVEPHHRN
jgi:hypothetical protein